MAIDTLRVSEVAKLLSVSDSSIRNWSAAAAAFLSPGAVTPPPHGERLYSPRDVQVLTLYKQLRIEQRIPAADIPPVIAAAVDAGQLPPFVDDDRLSGMALQQVQEARDLWLQEREALQRDIQAMQAQIATLTGQLDAERAGRRADTERIMSTHADTLAALHARLARAEYEAELWRTGKLRPDTP